MDWRVRGLRVDAPRKSPLVERLARDGHRRPAEPGGRYEELCRRRLKVTRALSQPSPTAAAVSSWSCCTARPEAERFAEGYMPGEGGRLRFHVGLGRPAYTLLRQGRHAFAAGEDPDAVRLTFTMKGGRADKLLLRMASMHWYAERVCPAGCGEAGRRR